MAGRLTARHRLTLALLAVVVVGLHGGVTQLVADRMADASAERAMPPRMEVAYVREMELAAPVAVAALGPELQPRAQRPVRAASAPASSPVEAIDAPSPEPVESRAEAPAPPPPEPQPATVAEAPDAAASAPMAEPAVAAASMPASEPLAQAAAEAASAPAFEWPASTRVSYRLTGNYRGEIEGDAQVEWVHAGARYQVHLDVTVGLSFAPLLTRRMSSDGEITPEGLRPQRYDEDSKVAFRDRRRLTMLFEPDAIVLANGERRERLPGVQDTASQFVQLTYLFSLNPQKLVAGGTVELPLALPRKVARWTYDVLGSEPVHTPFGAIEAFHLKPRPLADSENTLRAEIWFAPQLRHLPVRIRIEQDRQTYIDLVIARRPQLAAAR